MKIQFIPAISRTSLMFLLGLALLLPAGSGARAENTLEKVRRRGVLIIGTDATYPPFELKVGDRFEGFDIDLGNAIGEELGVKVQWENINWDGIFAGLQAGKFDMLLSDVVITDKRKQEMAFSRPYFLSGQTVVRRIGDARIRTVRDLQGKLATVQQETTGQYAIEKMKLPGLRIRKFETMQDALLEVTKGRGDAAVGDMPALTAMIRKGYPELETVGGIFIRENYGAVVRKDDAELLAAVNAALATIFAGKRYGEIYERWIREPLPPGYAAGLDKVQGQGSVISTKPGGGSAMTIRWGQLQAAMPLLLQGARMTLYITGLSLLIGMPLGLGIALLRLTPWRALTVPATIYVEILRGTPLLVQIFLIYFVLPWQLSQMPAAVAALSLNAAAYISEIFRAGIGSIDSGQMEAARALGFDYLRAMRFVVLPQTLRRVLPPLTNESVALLKDSSLVSVIGLGELMGLGRQQASNAGSPVTIFLGIALLYLVMTLPLTYLVRVLEARWKTP